MAQKVGRREIYSPVPPPPNEHCCYLPKPLLQNDSQMNELQIGHEMVPAPAKENEVYKQIVVYSHLKAKES